jgi:hypothetical protein
MSGVGSARHRGVAGAASVAKAGILLLVPLVPDTEGDAHVTLGAHANRPLNIA